MKARGYLDEPEATAATLRVHPDGRTWLHTGDIGRMDEDGFFHRNVWLAVAGRPIFSRPHL